VLFVVSLGDADPSVEISAGQLGHPLILFDIPQQGIKFTEVNAVLGMPQELLDFLVHEVSPLVDAYIIATKRGPVKAPLLLSTNYLD
jgi:hypothetical protein